MPVRPTVWTLDLVEKIRDLRRAGLSRQEIAQRFDVPPHRITYVIYKYDLAPSRPHLTPRTFAEAVDVMAYRYGVKPADILSRQRKAPIVRARQAVMHELHQKGYSLPQIGQRFGVDHSTVWWGCRRAHAKASANYPRDEKQCGRLSERAPQVIERGREEAEAV